MIASSIQNTLPQFALAAGESHAEAPPPEGHATLPGWEQTAEAFLFSVVDVGIALLALAFLMSLWRVLKGPTLVDRGLATDTMAMQVVGLAVLVTIRLRSLIFFDAVLIISILGFASTIAFAQFIGRRRAV